MDIQLEFQTKINIDCCLIFPDQCSKFLYFLQSNITTSPKFNINCKGIKYGTTLTQELANEINQALSETDIIIMGYRGAISHDNCYKLGLAHAHSKQVILIDLSKSDPIEIPPFIMYRFFIKLGNEERGVQFLVEKLENILFLIVSRDIYGILYQKAIDFCEEFSQTTGVEIQTFTKREFIALIDRNILTRYTNWYLNNNNNLRYTLLKLATKNKESLFQYFNDFIQDSEVFSELLGVGIMSENSKYNIKANVVQIVENNLGEVLAKKYAKDPDFTEAITEIIQTLALLQQDHPEATDEAEAENIIKTKFEAIKINQPNKWQALQRQLLNRECWLNGGKTALSESAKQYVDNNVFYKAGLAFLDGFIADKAQGGNS